MARVLVADDDTANWDGGCTGCGWTVSEHHTRFNDLDDAVHGAIVHLDHQH